MLPVLRVFFNKEAWAALGHKYISIYWLLFMMAAYLQRLESIRVSVAVQDDVVGHAEAFSHSQVVEERRLAEGICHLHHSYVWW